MAFLNTCQQQGIEETGVIHIIAQPSHELAEAFPPSIPAREGAIELLIDGIAEGTSGFAVHLRDWARHLAKYGVQVFIPNNRKSEYPEIREMHIDPNADGFNPIELLNYAGGGFHDKNPNRFVIGLTVFETESFPTYFRDNARNVDELWCPSNFCYDRFLRVGVPKDKIRIFPEGVDVELFNPHVPPSIDANGKFIFGNICGWSERKGISVLLNAFLKEFDRNEDVVLYISGGWYAEKVALSEVEEVKKAIGKANYPNVILDWNDKLDWEMPALFNSFDCLCNPTKGEGYCRPIVEALSCAVPVIVTDAPPMNEVVNKSNGYPIKISHIGPEPRADWICDWYKGADFFHPDEDDLRAQMRHVFEHREEPKEKAKKGREDIKKNHNVALIIEDVVERLCEIAGHA